MNLFNTLTRKIEEFTPLHPEEIGVYTCGPTVYNHAHIGNLSSYIFSDILRRVLSVQGLSVKQIMNYTDVDDKTIKASVEQYPNEDPKIALKRLTDRYIELFLADMAKIGNDVDAISFVRATDSIEQMKELTARLVKNGFAYVADDGVYFSIEAYKKSGKKYGQLLEINAENTSEARIANDEYDKESVHDFALWKKAKQEEPQWDFEIDGQNLSGRPGWHIECSVMSANELRQPFDIHTGGVDLIFPHHENEIAQSTALESNPVMAKLFVHNEHMLVDGKKMAKSANNFYTLDNIIEKGYDPLAFRLLVLQSHYRSQAHFSWENLDAAQNRLKNWKAFADLRFQTVTYKKSKDEHPVQGSEIEKTWAAIVDAVQSDLSTPQAIAEIEKIIDQTMLRNIDNNSLNQMDKFLNDLDKLFGLSLSASDDITNDQKDLINQREQAREAKDWTKADELRGKLLKANLELRDTPNGPIWNRL